MKLLLTIEQSAEFIKRGVSGNKVSRRTPDYHDTPIFTLADLLSLLPKVIYRNDSIYPIELIISWDRHNQMWYAGYNFFKDDFINHNFGAELIDSLYNLLLWAIDNNHVKLD